MSALSRASLRAGLAGVLVVPGLVLGAGVVAAEEEPLTIDRLPSISDNELSGYVDRIAIPDIEGIDIPEIEAFEPEVEESGEETVVSLQTDVLFRFGEASLSSGAKDAVAAAVADLPEDAAVDVVGHTDSVGSDADNKKLSTERAEAVATVIEDERDDLDLDVSGKGESDPAEPNERGGEDNPEGREKNRRVELRYSS